VLSKKLALMKNQDGATIIEYALVAPILFLMVFAIIEFALVMYATSVIETAASAGARYGITGSSYDVEAAQDPCNSARATYIRQAVDKLSMGLVDTAKITITTEVFDDYTNVAPKFDSKTANYGCGNQVIMYNVQYDWDITTPFISQYFNGGVYTIQSHVLVKNEDFGAGP
jgi:Flp pilus assembly protein TadG